MSPKSYDEYCPVARALDVLGERWTLLIVRDLLMGPKRYTDLRDGLPRIATDLLTARLRTLESSGFVERRELPRPAPATVYALTDAGCGLGPAVLALGKVGLPLLGAPQSAQSVRAERLVLALQATFCRTAFPGLAEAYQLQIDGEPYAVAVAGETVETRPGNAADPAVSLTTDAATLVELLRGDVAPAGAIARGAVTLEGDRAAFERFAEAFAYPASRSA